MAGSNGTAWRPLYEAGYPPIEAPGDDFLGWMHAQCDPGAYGVTTSGESTDAVEGSVTVALPPQADAFLRAALDHTLAGEGPATGDATRTYAVNHPEVRGSAAVRAAQVVRAWLAWQKFPEDPALHFFFDQFVKAVPGMQDAPGADRTVGPSFMPEDADPAFCAMLEATVALAAQSGQAYYVWEGPDGLMAHHATRPHDPAQPFVYVTPVGDLHVYAVEPVRLAQAFMREDATPVSVHEIAESTHTLTEAFKSSAESLDDPNRPLAKQYTQYVHQGNVFAPAGPGVFAEALGRHAYRIVPTMNGVEFHRAKPKTDELYHFKDSTMERVIAEIDRFWSLREDYKKLGALHHRGILLAGPPGTGKTSLIHQVAEMMVGRGDVVFYASRIRPLIEALNAFRQVEATRPVVVILEDADEHIKYDQNDFLQLLDGDQAVDSVLYLATTNYLESFPPRLRRPGRFDHIVEVGPPPAAGRLAYLQHKLGTFEKAAEIARLAKVTEGMSFGHLRELVLAVYAIKEPVAEVLERLRTQMGTPLVAETPRGSGWRESVTEALTEKALTIPKATRTTKPLQGFTQDWLSGKRAPIEIPAGTPVTQGGVDMRDPIAGEPVTWLNVTLGTRPTKVGILNLPVLKRDWWKDYFTVGEAVDEVSPPGFSGTVSALKKHFPDDPSRAYKLAWAMYKKGAKPHKMPEKGKPGYVTPRTHASRQARKAAAKRRPLAASDDTVSGLDEAPTIHAIGDSGWKQATPARRAHWLRNHIAFLKDQPTRTGKRLDPGQQRDLDTYEARLAQIVKMAQAAEEGLDEAAPQWVTDTLATIGGRRGLFMLGVKNALHDEKTKSVILQLGRNASGGNVLVLHYDQGADLYDVRIEQRSRAADAGIKVKHETKGIDAEAVGPWVERTTGMRLSLGTMGRTEGTDEAAVERSPKFLAALWTANMGPNVSYGPHAQATAVWWAQKLAKVSDAPTADEVMQAMVNYPDMVPLARKDPKAMAAYQRVADVVKVWRAKAKPAPAAEAVLDTLVREFPQRTRAALAEMLRAQTKGLTLRDPLFRAVVERAATLAEPAGTRWRVENFDFDPATLEPRRIRVTVTEASPMRGIVYPKYTKAVADLKALMRKEGYTLETGDAERAQRLNRFRWTLDVRAKTGLPWGDTLNTRVNQEEARITAVVQQDAPADLRGKVSVATGDGDVQVDLPFTAVGGRAMREALTTVPIPPQFRSHAKKLRATAEKRAKATGTPHYVVLRHTGDEVSVMDPDEFLTDQRTPQPGRVAYVANPATEAQAAVQVGDLTEARAFDQAYNEYGANAATAWQYVRAIRNDAKRKYAQAYLDYIVKHTPKPDSSTAGVGYMAAQSVRTELADFGIEEALVEAVLGTYRQSAGAAGTLKMDVHGIRPLPVSIAQRGAHTKGMLQVKVKGVAGLHWINVRPDDLDLKPGVKMPAPSESVTEAFDPAASPGKTRSGKTIPAFADPAYTTGYKFPKITGNVSPVRGMGFYTEAAKALRRNLPDWTQQDHADAATAHALAGNRADNEWGKVRAAEHLRVFKAPAEFTDYKISGIGREEYSPKVKDRLRALAHGATEHHGLGKAHDLAKKLRGGWKPAPSEAVTEAFDPQASVGKTRSGKTIPAVTDPAYTTGYKFPKIQGEVSPARERSFTDKAAQALRRNLPDWTKPDFADAAAAHAKAAETADAEWGTVRDAEHQRVFKKPAEFTDYKISGIGREEYSDKVKDRLRALAHGASQHRGLAAAHTYVTKHLTRGMTKEGLDEAATDATRATADAGLARLDADMIEAAKVIGVAQKGILQALRANPDARPLTDIARHAALRGVHFTQILGAAESLVRKGLVTKDGTQYALTTGTTEALTEAMFAVGAWQHPGAQDYADRCMAAFGEPNVQSTEAVTWHDEGGFDEITVRDEFIPHDFPRPHHDFVYATRALLVPAHLTDEFAAVTGSILIDGLKGTVTARCGSLLANAVTLGFVADVVAGSAKPTKAEYAKRILGGVAPDWFTDPLREKAEHQTEQPLGMDYGTRESITERIQGRAKTVTLQVTVPGVKGALNATYPVGAFPSPDAAAKSLRTALEAANLGARKARVGSAVYGPGDQEPEPGEAMEMAWDFYLSATPPPATSTPHPGTDEAIKSKAKSITFTVTLPGAPGPVSATYPVGTFDSPQAAEASLRNDWNYVVQKGRVASAAYEPKPTVDVAWGEKTPLHVGKASAREWNFFGHVRMKDKPETPTEALEVLAMDEGRITTPKYVAELFSAAGTPITTGPIPWASTEDGPPNAANLKTFAERINKIPGVKTAVLGSIRLNVPGGAIVARWGTQAESSTKGPYDFKAKEAHYRTLPMGHLLHAKTDAAKSRDLMRGHDTAAENWYADDVHTLLKEISRRKAGGKQEPEEAVADDTLSATATAGVRATAAAEVAAPTTFRG